MIISKLEKSAGFFSQLFFSINHYIYARKNNHYFLLDTNEWLYKHNYGWNDYFVPPYVGNVDNIDDSTFQDIKTVKFFDILEDYSIEEYKKYIPEFFQYNTNLKHKINEVKSQLKISTNEYGAIYIRRGDKLFYESKLITIDNYIELLLEKYPNCKIIYLQTDDYTCFEELEEYIKQNNLNIRAITLCSNTQRGTLVSRAPNIITTQIKKNEEYVEKVRTRLHQTTEIVNMSNEQIKEHTMEMLMSLDITLSSKVCVTDFQSNVARFIKLAHHNYDAVFEVTGIEMDLNKKICPSYPTCVYENPDEYARL